MYNKLTMKGNVHQSLPEAHKYISVKETAQDF